MSNEKTRYTMTVNHGEYARDIFDTREEADARMEKELLEDGTLDEVNEAKRDGSLDELGDAYGYHIMEISVPDETKKHRLKLVSISVPSTYGTLIPSRFLATDVEIENHEMLFGIELDFGEYEGEYSEVYGTFNKEDMVVTELPYEVGEAILNYVGKHIEGEQLLDHYDVLEIYHAVFAVIGENLADVLSEETTTLFEERIGRNNRLKKEDGKYNVFSYIHELEQILPIKGLIKWTEQIGEDYEEVAVNLPKDVKDGLKAWIDESVARAHLI